MFDILIKNAYILDGSGAPGFHADLAIKDGRIARIAPGLSDAAQLLDARGLAVSPGWIDSHSHSDNAMLTHPDMLEKIEQGITFSVTGHCGTSPAPISTESFQSFFKKVGPQGSGAAVLVGHNTLRRTVMGRHNRAPTPEEQARMEQLLEESLEQGAMGLSLGLYYVPGCYAEMEEVIRLAKITAEHGKVLTAHIRDEGDGLIPSVEEFLAVVKASGCRAVLSHHKAAWQENWGKVNTTLAMIDQANADGADIYLDVYPYTASATSLLARFLPRQFHPPGTTDPVQLLTDPALRERVLQWGHSKWSNDLSWTLVSSCPGHREYEGLDMNRIADLMDQPDRLDAALQLLLESGGKAMGYFFMMCPEDVETVLRHERAMLCTDSSVAKNQRLYHPRLRAAFPRALGHFVREQGTVSLPEMIRKMTGLPAHVYDLPKKGRIEEGMDADLCIFDPERIRDQADYQNCSAPNQGLRYVLIDGRIVLENGVYNGTRAGKIYKTGPAAK